MLRGRWLRASWSCLACALICSAAAAAETSGRLVGEVLFESGRPLADAAVIVVGSAGASTHRATTNEEGAFRFEGLLPGVFTVSVSREGSTEAKVEGVVVEVGKTSLVRVWVAEDAPGPEVSDSEDEAPPTESDATQSAASVVEAPEVVVRRRPPAIEHGTGTGIVVDARTHGRLAGVTDVASAASLAPGTAHDRHGLTIRGSSSPENSWVVDGLETTSVGSGLPTTNLPIEFVEQISVRTGGYGAQYAGAGGGAVDVATRSGGDSWAGDVILGWAPGALSSDRVTVPGGRGFVSRESPSQALDLGLSLGGPLVADRAWVFFGVVPYLERVDYTSELGRDASSPLVSREYNRTSTRMAHFGRLDLRAGENQHGHVSFFGTPSRSTGVVDGALQGDDASILGRERAGALNVMGRWTSRLSEGRLLVTSTAGYHEQRDVLLPPPELSSDVVGTRHQFPYLAEEFAELPQCAPADPEDPATSPCSVDEFVTGPFRVLSDSGLSRATAGLTFSRSIERFGFHVLRWGGRFDLDRYMQRSGVHGGAIQLDFGPESPLDFRYQRRTMGALDEDGVYTPTDWLATDAHALNAALFVNDSWEPSHGLRFDAGLRLEAQSLRNPGGNLDISLAPLLSPRVGAAWDWTGEGSSRLFAHYGRYQQRVPLNVSVRSGDAITGVQYLADDGTNLTPEMSGGSDYILIGNEASWVQPVLGAPYHDEITLGVERAFSRRLAVGVALVRRTVGRVVEDVAIKPDASRFGIANPGSERSLDAAEADARERLSSSSAEDVERAEDDLEAIAAVRGFPRPARTYEALELTVRSAPWSRTTIVGSLVLSRLQGNYSGFFSPQNEQLDANVTSQFDLQDLLENSHGPLRQDRPLRVRIDARQEIAGGLDAGLSVRYASGRPIDLLGSHELYGRNEVFILPRGAGGRTPRLYDLDVGVGYSLPVGGGIEARMDLVVFNLLNLQRAVEVDDAFTNDVVTALKDADLDDVMTWAHAEDGAGSETPRVNPGWGEPRSPRDLQPPRFVELRLKASF